MVVGPGVILEPLAAVLVFLKCSFFFAGRIKSSAGFPNVTPRTICTGNFIYDVGLRFHGRSKFRSWELCCSVVNGLFTTVTSCFLRIHVKGSVTPLM